MTAEQRSGALTVRLNDRSGHFDYVEDDGRVVASGRARASKSVPGHVTLLVDWSQSKHVPVCLRVPADWIAAGESLHGS